MKTKYKATINKIEEFNEFTAKVEKDSGSRFELERYLLQKRYPQAITYTDAIAELEKDLPVEIVVNKNTPYFNTKIYDKDRVIVRKIKEVS